MHVPSISKNITSPVFFGDFDLLHHFEAAFEVMFEIPTKKGQRSQALPV